VQWKTSDDGQRNCLKHEEFYSKNKSEKLVHLVGFIIRIYHDARSLECQIGPVVLISQQLAFGKTQDIHNIVRCKVQAAGGLTSTGKPPCQTKLRIATITKIWQLTNDINNNFFKIFEYNSLSSLLRAFMTFRTFSCFRRSFGPLCVALWTPEGIRLILIIWK